MEMSMSRYPAEHCTAYIDSVWNLMSAAAAEAAKGPGAPLLMASASAASWVVKRHLRAAAKPSTEIPTSMVKNMAPIMEPPDVMGKSRYRNATHGALGSAHPRNPSMYMLTGRILSLQKELVLPPARRATEGGGAVALGANGGGGDGAAAHVGSQSKQCEVAPMSSGHTSPVERCWHLRSVPAPHAGTGASMHDSQQ
jgi:hypothetical protein